MALIKKNDQNIVWNLCMLLRICLSVPGEIYVKIIMSHCSELCEFAASYCDGFIKSVLFNSNYNKTSCRHYNL